MTNTFLSSFSGVFIIILAFLSQIFHFGCHTSRENGPIVENNQIEKLRMLDIYIWTSVPEDRVLLFCKLSSNPIATLFKTVTVQPGPILHGLRHTLWSWKSKSMDNFLTFKCFLFHTSPSLHTLYANFKNSTACVSM